MGIGNYLIKVKGNLKNAESDIVEKRYIITILPLAELENFEGHTDYYTTVLLKLKNLGEKITYEAKLNDEIIEII